MLSKTNNFIFVHIPKTAGVSITRTLKPLMSHQSISGLHPHVQANVAKRILGDKFDAPFKFAFVRNPWARMYSYYHFMRKDYPIHKERYDRVVRFETGSFMTQEFNDWIITGKFYHRTDSGVVPIPEQRRCQLNWITNTSGKLLVDFIGRVETINVDWKHISNQIGIKYVPLPKYNVSTQHSYRNAYTQEAIDSVALHFKQDIDTFGYDF